MLYPPKEIANFITRGIRQSKKRSCFSHIQIPPRDHDIREGVGADCLFRVGRLAMPLRDKQEVIPRFFVKRKLPRIGMRVAFKINYHGSDHCLWR